MVQQSEYIAMETTLTLIPETPNISASDLSDLEHELQMQSEMFDINHNYKTDVRIKLMTELVNEMKATISSMSDEIVYLKDDARQKNETINYLIAKNDLPTTEQIQGMKDDIKDLSCERKHIRELVLFLMKQLEGQKSFTTNSVSTESSDENEVFETGDSSAYLDKIYWENGIKNGLHKNVTLRKHQSRMAKTHDENSYDFNDHDEFLTRLARLRRYDSEISATEKNMENKPTLDIDDKKAEMEEKQDELCFQIFTEMILGFGMQIHHSNHIHKTRQHMKLPFESDIDFNASTNCSSTDACDGDDESLPDVTDKRKKRTRKVKGSENQNIVPHFIDRGLGTKTTEGMSNDISVGESRHKDFAAWEKSSNGFGSKILKMYGYSGKGLGKTENGIVNPITIESKKSFAKNTDKSEKKSDIFRKKNYVHPWPEGTTLITGSSILLGIQEGKLRNYKAKVRAFSGATVDDMHDYLKPLLRKKPDNIILHIGTNDSLNKSAKDIMEEIINLVEFIESELPTVNLCISCPVMRIDNMRANKVLRDLSFLITSSFRSNIIIHDKFNGTCLGHKGLHLNAKGSTLLVTNYISHMPRL